jgi:hypothetical protein
VSEGKRRNGLGRLRVTRFLEPVVPPRLVGSLDQSGSTSKTSRRPSRFSVRPVGNVMTTAINLSVSAVAMALGIFIASSPERAAGIWASERLEGSAPPNRASFLRRYRAFGIVICLGGALFALDSIGFWN